MITDVINNEDLTSTPRNTEGWWERFVPLLIPILLVPLFIVYWLPTNPDLVPLLVISLFLAEAALLYVGQQVTTRLKQPDYRFVEERRGGTSALVQKRRFVGWTIRAALALGALTCVHALLSLVFSSELEYPLPGVFSRLLACLIFSALFALLWTGRARRLEQLLDTSVGFWLSAVAVCGVVVATAYASFFLAPNRISEGTPASWETLLQFAQRQAERIDKGNTLEAIHVRPPYYLDPPFSPQDTPLQVDFDFRRSDGHSSRLEILDIDPPRIVSMRRDWDTRTFLGISGIPSDELLTYKERLSYLKISPRDAYRLTEQEGLAFAQEVAPGQPPTIDASLFLEHDWQDWFGVVAGWNVEYTVHTNEGYRSLALRVDGATGNIIRSERRPEAFQVTPTAQITSIAIPNQR